jgi:hypothetical protein
MIKTPASVTAERQKRARNLAYSLYQEYTIDTARQIIKEHHAEASEEGQKFWSLVRNSYESIIAPPRHKPKDVCIAYDQYTLEGRLARGGSK